MTILFLLMDSKSIMNKTTIKFIVINKLINKLFIRN